MTRPHNNHPVMVRIVAAAAACLLLLSISLFAEEAPAADAGITAGTDALVYAPGDTITLNLAFDAGDRNVTGDIQLNVYPAASPLADDPFAPAPVAQKQLAAGINVNGTGSASVSVAVADLGLGTGGYPARVILENNGQELLSGEVWLAVVAAGAGAPVDLILLWTDGGPPQRNAQHEFVSSSLVERCRNEPRSPDSLLQHEAIARDFPGVRTTFAVEAQLLDELVDMTDGFVLTDAEGTRSFDAASIESVQVTSCVESLKQLATYENVDIISTPYTFADLTLLARENWSDGTGQYRLGHDILTGTLLLPDVPDGAYIPLLNLTTDSLRYIAATGGEYSVLAGYTRSGVQGRDDNAVSYRLRDLSGERLTGFFADDDISAALLGSSPDANAFFAGLANIYAAGAPLAIAAATEHSPPISADARSRVYAEIESQPWINSITLTEAKDKYRPDSEPASFLRYVDTAVGYVTRIYYSRMAEVHEMFEDYRAAVDSEEPQMVRLTKLMFASESSFILGADPEPEAVNRGLQFLEEIESMVREEVSGLEISIDTPFMQYSSSGTAKVTIHNNNPYAFTVVLSLVAEDEGVTFPDGDAQELRVESGVSQVIVPYQSDSWAGIDARLLSRGNVLVEDSAGIRPLNARFWLAVLIVTALLSGGVLYYVFVIKRGYA